MHPHAKFMTPQVWKNGELITWDEANDHNVNHGLHYGTAVFEGIRFYDTPKGPKVFKLKEHIERLLYSAKVVGLSVPYSCKEIMQGTLDAVAASGECAGYIRPIVYVKPGRMGVHIADGSADVVISIWKWGKYIDKESADIKIADKRRIHPSTTDVNAKIAGHYVNSVLAAKQVHAEGFDEALLLDTDWFVAEGSGENVFFLVEDTLYTPKTGNILPGITRDTIMQIAQEKFNLTVIETEVLPEDLDQFDEAFFVGTAAEVTPIASITSEQGEKVSYAPKLSFDMRDAYLKITWWKDEWYSNWLS